MLQGLQRIQFYLDELKTTEQQLNTCLQQEQTKLLELDEQLKRIIDCRQYYKKAVDVIYERCVVELKELLNSALAYVFKDRNFEMDIELNDKRGKSLSFIIYEDGKPVNLRCAMGMGVKCVISVVLHMYYLQCNNSNVLILDETYSNISKGYTSLVFDFITQMCEKLNFKMIIITHDERFLDYGTKTYIFKVGEVLQG